MQTAVIYARYSSENQTEQSIDGQLRVCKEYAQRNGILILDTYIDRAMTGTNDNRPDFQRMIKDSSRKEWNYILVYKLDRFSRDKYATAIHKRTLKNNGVKVLSAMENIPDTPEGIILESLLEGMNQYYSAELAQKISRGMKETRLKGNYQGGGIPYGYKIDGRKLVIDESRAEIVRFMYSQFAKGVFVKDIISELTAKGILYKNKRFATNTVYNILKNEKYSGIYKHGEEVIDNMYPQIIDNELFEKVRKIVNANKYGKRSIKVVYLLRNKLKCGYCGRPISAETGTARNGEVIRYYKCLGRKKDRNGCNKAMIRKDELELIIVNNIVQELSKQTTLEKIVFGLMQIQNSQTQVNAILNMLIKEKQRTETAIDNMLTAIESGVITTSTTKRLKELESRQEELERQMLIERSKTVIKLTERDIREYYEQALKLEPQMLINYLIKEIVLFNDKIEIHYNSPIKVSPDDDENRGFIFYSDIVKLNGIKVMLKMII